MTKDIAVDSFYHVPIENLTTEYKELLDSLTFPNPENTRAGFTGGGFYKKDVPKNIRFYGLDKVHRQVLLPRNISKKYFIYNNIIYNTCEGTFIGSGFSDDFSLRDYQEEFFETQVLPYIEAKKDEGFSDVLLECECGSGKTIMSLYLAGLYGRRTVVAVTKRPIGEQFITAVKDLFPNWSVGWYEEGSDFDITIGTYSLFSQDSYGSDFFEQFGHIIMDEYHRVGAATYCTILEKAACKYRTTLTATFRRKDGLHKALAVHIGDILEMPKRARKAVILPVFTKAAIEPILFKTVQKKYIKMPSAAMYSDVCVKNDKRREIDRGMVTDSKDPVYHNGELRTEGFVQLDSVIFKEKRTYPMPQNGIMLLGNISVSAIDSEITENEIRNNQVFDAVKKCVAEGRKVLILSKRKEQLSRLHKKSLRRGINSGLIVSAKDRDYNNYAKDLGFKNGQEYGDWVLANTDVIYGIDKLAEEGLDIPSFDTIVYLHPIKDIEQSIGRITRDYEGKKEPMGIVFVDDIAVYKNMLYGRHGAMKMFEDLEHTVKPQVDIEKFLKG